MEIKITHLSGAHQGESVSFKDQETIKAGRQPGNDIAFDPRSDIRASGNHAELRLEEGQYVVYDMKSTNGTFVNKEKVTKQVLKNNDVIEFGKGGPQLRFNAVAYDPTLASTSGFESAGEVSGVKDKLKSGGKVGAKTVQMMISDALKKSKQSKGGRFGSTTIFMKEVVSQAVKESSAKLRIVTISIIVLLLTGSGYLYYQNLELREELNASLQKQENELLNMEDEFNQELTRSEERSGILEGQMEQAQKDATIGKAKLQALQDLLDTERQNRDALAGELQNTQDRLTNLSQMTKNSLKALRSFQDASADVTESVYMICGYNTATGMATPIGTGFAVRANGLIFTNAHVGNEVLKLQNEFGSEFTGIAIQNKNSDNIYLIQSIQIHPEYQEGSTYSPDMAALEIDTKGHILQPVTFASVDESNSLGEGYELAVFGFPGITMDPQDPVATLSRGAVGRMVEGQYIQHDCQTSGGNSGSPIINKQGHVVGIHYGGRGNQIVFVPVAVLDSNNEPVLNDDGTIQTTMGRQRIKEAVGINIGVRCDVIEDFLFTIP